MHAVKDKTEDLNLLYKTAIQSRMEAKEEKERKNIEKIQIASDELYNFCIDNLKGKIESNSKEGRNRLRLYSCEAYEKINNLPIIFLAYGGKEEGYQIFNKLGINSVHMQLGAHFKGSPFRFTIKTRKTPDGQKIIDFDLFWT